MRFCDCPKRHASIWVSCPDKVRCPRCRRLWRAVVCLTAATLALVLVPVTEELHVHEQPSIYREFVSPGNTPFVTSSGTSWLYYGQKAT